jgi:hypothetical protein
LVIFLRKGFLISKNFSFIIVPTILNKVGDMAVLGTFSAIHGGMLSAGFTWLSNKTGVVQNLARTVSPSLIGAFGFEAINRSVAYGSSSLNERVKKDLLPDQYGLHEGTDALQFMFALASRYAVARFCNNYFGSKITTNFVHLYTASDVVYRSTRLDAGGIVLGAFMGGVVAKIMSVFIKTPLFKNAFYFGVVLITANTLALKTSQRVRMKTEESFGPVDQNMIVLAKMAFVGMTLMSIQYQATVFNRKLKIDIPRPYVVFVSILTALDFWNNAFRKLNEIEKLALNADGNKLIGQLLTAPPSFWIYLNSQRATDADSLMDPMIHQFRDSGNAKLQEIAVQLQEIVDNADSAKSNILWNRFQGCNHANIGKALRGKLSAILDQVVWALLRGKSLENIDGLDNFDEITKPIMDTLRIVFGVALNHEGADFVLQEVLKDASQQTREALETMDSGRATPQFIATKAVALYVVGSKKDEAIPEFFSADMENKQGERVKGAQTKILELRNRVQADSALIASYEVVLQHLNAATAGVDEDVGFFAFEDELQAGSRELEALTVLKAIGYQEQRSNFARNCCRIAAARLAAEDGE